MVQAWQISQGSIWLILDTRSAGLSEDDSYIVLHIMIWSLERGQKVSPCLWYELWPSFSKETVDLYRWTVDCFTVYSLGLKISNCGSFDGNMVWNRNIEISEIVKSYVTLLWMSQEYLNILVWWPCIRVNPLLVRWRSSRSLEIVQVFSDIRENNKYPSIQSQYKQSA